MLEMQAKAAKNMVRIFVTQPVPDTTLAPLRALANVFVYSDSSRILPRDDLLREIPQCDILYCLLHDRIDSKVIEAGQRLKLIATSAITPTNVDVASATTRMIPVTAIPNIVAEDTADLQWGLVLAVARRIPQAERGLRGGIFPGAQSMHFAGGRVHGKTLGTIGLGAIGRGIARRAQGFGMRVLYTKRTRLSPEQERQWDVEYRSLHDLLRESDFVVLNATLHAGTQHLIGPSELRLIKPSAYFINTARGPIVDEGALVEALKTGAIAGAGLDVYEREPHVHPELLSLGNVVLTPHIGTATRDMRAEIASIVVHNIEAFLRGERPPNVYNPEIYG
jgi:glyoxylate reductase